MSEGMRHRNTSAKKKFIERGHGDILPTLKSDQISRPIAVIDVHPLRETSNHVYTQICTKICKFYGVSDAEQWYAQERKVVINGREDKLGIARFDTLAEYWEIRQMSEKWNDTSPSWNGPVVSDRGVVEIYAVRAPGAGGELGILTTTHDPVIFCEALASAVAKYMTSEPRTQQQVERDMHWILKNALPIAFKLSGYKADQVSERHVLTCGSSAPSADDILASA